MVLQHSISNTLRELVATQRSDAINVREASAPGGNSVQSRLRPVRRSPTRSFPPPLKTSSSEAPAAANRTGARPLSPPCLPPSPPRPALVLVDRAD